MRDLSGQFSKQVYLKLDLNNDPFSHFRHKEGLEMEQAPLSVVVNLFTE